MTYNEDSNPPLRRRPTHQYRKDIRKLEKSGFDMAKLEHVVDLLAHHQALPESCRDHGLKGSMYGIRACHIKPDWLLLYQKDYEELFLLLVASGTHRDTLGIE